MTLTTAFPVTTAALQRLRRTWVDLRRVKAEGRMIGAMFKIDQALTEIGDGGLRLEFRKFEIAVSEYFFQDAFDTSLKE